MHDNRKYERFEIPLEVKVTWPDHEEHVGITKDFSDGGALLAVVFDMLPETGTLMELQLTSQVNGQDAPVLRARVVRSDSNETAFEFISPPEE
jgi:c-di-GMP-binding flagellar brake protein YcgR